ncbi:MAG TPA: methyltransferase domain-containing protein, partial [Rhodothermia bacterium]
EGAVEITNVDAAPAYMTAAEQEARRRGYANLVTYLRGDFVELAHGIEHADLVTMDRVVCCYPNLVKLLRPAAERARVSLGLVFPRDNWWMRAGAHVANLLLRLGRSEFQAFIHPHANIEQCAAEAGLGLCYSAYRGLWRVALFVRA